MEDNLNDTEYISLKEEDLSRYNYEDVLKESIKLLQNLNIKTPFPNNIQTKGETIESDILSRRSSISSIDSSIAARDIPRSYLENPIDLVNYLEYGLQNEKNDKLNKKFILKSYEEKNDIKYEIMNINTDKEINRAIFLENKLITSIYYYGYDSLITGNIFGQIKIYSLYDKKKIKFIESPFLNEEKNIQITTIDLTKDNKYIFIGYSNGSIVFAEIMTQKIKLVINDIITNSECLFVKFINQEGRFFQIFATDQKGNIFSIKIKDGITGCRVIEYKNIYENEYENNPIYFIKILEFNKETLDKNPFLKNIDKYIILASLKFITIFNLIDNSKLDIKYKIDKPEWIKDSIISDICFGLGQHPQSREDSDENDDNPQILMCICFNDVINLYLIPIDNKEITYPILIGHYLNINKDGNNQIVRIGFLSKGCIFLIDRSNHFKILTTKKFIKGEQNINKETSIIKEDLKLKYKKAEIQNMHPFNTSINYQINIKVSNNQYKQSYFNSVVQNFNNNNIAVLCDQYLYIIDFIEYDFYLKRLQRNEKWIEILILGIDLYKGKITCMKDIPQNSEERKKKLRDDLEQFISVYIIADDMNQKNEEISSYYESQKYLNHTEEKIEMIIEFCMEIEGFDFLLDKIFNIYEAKKFGNLFLDKLESFIMCDKLLNYEIDEDLILKLIKFYEEKNKIKTLNRLLLHIDNKTLISSSVRDKIKELNLFSPMISIYVNGENPDYFKPVLLLYEKFEQSQKLNFFSYEKAVEKYNIEDIKESKEYKGHKLFWYMLKSFTKRKYPYFINNMEENEYNKYIIDLTFWLMKPDIINNLFVFNSKLYCDVVEKIFMDKNNLKIIESLNQNEEEKMKKMNEQNYNYLYEDLSPNNLLNYIIEQAKKIEGEQKMKLEFNIFIIKCYKNKNLSNDTIINSIIFILDVYDIIYSISDEKTEKIIKKIINIFNTEDIFTESDYGNILLHFNSNTFEEIKICIYEKIKKYKNCLEVLFNKECIINNKAEKLYEIVNKIFLSLKNNKDNDKHNYLDFKKLIADNINNIGEISSDVMIKIIYDYFSESFPDKKLIIEKLEKNIDLQFIYINYLYNQYISYFKRENENKAMISSEDEDFIQFVFGLYIKLLCETKQQNKVVYTLKQSQLFPYDYCLEICENYDVKNALIYLYQIAGDFQKALKTDFEMLDFFYNSINNNLKSDICKYNECYEQINNFDEYVNQSFEILIEMHNHKGEEEKELFLSNKEWFDALNKLYDFSIKFEEVLQNLPSNRKKIGNKFAEDLSEDIKLILEKMNSYISIEQILEEVSKNKIAGYREFKPLLYKIFESYDMQTSTLLYSNNLIKNLCFEKLSKCEILNKEGAFININKCNICGKEFEKIKNQNDKNILAFNCGHKMHFHCSKTAKIENKNVLICPICIKKQIDSEMPNSNEIEITDTKINEIKTEKKLNKDNIDINIYKAGFRRMRDINKNMINKNKTFISDCIRAKERIQYKVFLRNSSKDKSKKK